MSDRLDWNARQTAGVRTLRIDRPRYGTTGLA